MTGTADNTAAQAIRDAYNAAPKDCLGNARMLDLRALSGLPWHVFDATITALHRAYLIGTFWSAKPTSLDEDNASVLIDGTSRHLVVARWDDRPATHL